MIAALGLKIETAILPGDPREVIIDQARQWPADLIVVGSHGRRGMDHLLRGSVSEAVASSAHCTVEVIRESTTAGRRVWREGAQGFSRFNSARPTEEIAMSSIVEKIAKGLRRCRERLNWEGNNAFEAPGLPGYFSGWKLVLVLRPADERPVGWTGG